MSGEIEKLIERVEAATGEDRALDHAIYELLRPSLEVYSTFAPSGNMDGHWYWMASREYTGSVDAALALVEKVGDGSAEHPVEMTLSSVGKPVWRCAIWLGNEETDGVYRTAATPALAIILATLRALSSKEGM